MKHIKAYENIDEKKFWLIPTGKKLVLALKKIGASNLKHGITDICNQLSGKTKPIYFGYDQYGCWEWDNLNNFDLFLEDGYTYQGRVKVEDWEVNANKFNV